MTSHGVMKGLQSPEGTSLQSNCTRSLSLDDLETNKKVFWLRKCGGLGVNRANAVEPD
jgi:hypothetical protein